MALFEPTAFMNEEVPPNATERDARPIGEALGQVVKIDWATGTVGKPGPNYGKPWYRCDATIEVEDPQYLALRPNGGPPKETFRYGMMYDGDETGRPKIGPNVNVNLGRFREACNANGKPWAACEGAFVRIMVGNKPNPKREGSILDEVTAVTKP